MKTWEKIDPDHFDSVVAGQTVRVKWERGPEVSEVEGYVAFVSENFGDPVDLAHMVEDYRELCILHHHEAFWYRIIGFMDVWVLRETESDSLAEDETQGSVDAKRYVRDVLSRPENSEGVKHKDLWKSAWVLSEVLSERQVSQRNVKAAISEMVASGEVRAEEAPRTPDGRAGGTLHWLAK